MSSRLALEAKGATIYKKREGTLSISKDQKSLLWTPIQPRDAPPGATILIVDITNLQQTPETAPKVMLKVFEKPAAAAEPVTHIFNFNSPTDPRGEANAIKDSLTNLITASKANDASVPTAVNGSAQTKAVSAAVTSGTSALKLYDDAQLKNDIELQQSLMKKNTALQQTYMEARRTKPESISDSQFNSQFWSSRMNMLRAHAAQVQQSRGAYNVFSAIKPVTVNGEYKMSISAEQILLIFSQHPLVKQIYDENVPKISTLAFWERFMLSRLFKKLRGERITDQDTTDPTFDRYLERSSEDLSFGKRVDHVPAVIDLEGNDENQGGMKSGNKKDWTMIPSSSAKVPIIRTLNSLSEKLMVHVAPSDSNFNKPIGLDEEAAKALALQDLQIANEEAAVLLSIKQPSEIFADGKAELSAEAKLYAAQNPSDVLLEVEGDIALMNGGNSGGLDLQTSIGVLEDSDSEDEDKVAHVGSKASFISAQSHIMEGITTRRLQTEGVTEKASLAGLSQNMYQSLVLTQATTSEFLSHFWLLFLSGDPDRAAELGKIVESLDRAMDRINAVAAEAEKERQEVIAKQRQKIRDVYERTKKKINWDPSSVKGGEKVAMEMMAPVVKTLGIAADVYRKALAEQNVDGA